MDWRANSRAQTAEGALATSESEKVLALIDGLRLRRECLAHLLKMGLPDFEIVAVADVQPVDAWRAVRPDVVLMGLPAASLRGGQAIDEIAAAVAAAQGAPVLLVSETDDAIDEEAAAKFGVAGLFPATCGISLLLAAIELVLAGGRFHIPAGQPRAPQPPFGGGATR